MAESEWSTVEQPWVTATTEYGRRPPREDREFRSFTATIPPRIATTTFSFDTETERALIEATLEIAALEASATADVSAISGFLLRSESQSSSKIERIFASRDDFARAMAGESAPEAALEMARSAAAVTSMIAAADGGASVTQAALLAAHASLFEGNFLEHKSAGQYRSVQNWIGGSDFSPRDADYVPPPADEVVPLMHDLVDFMARDDLHPLAQAGIAHAQFESIHPFTDGNGRIGRATINAVLRARRVTRSTVVPVASVMLADTAGYFSRLTAVRNGDWAAFVGYLAECARTAAIESKSTVTRLLELPDEWRDRARPRRGSADERLIDSLLASPVVTARSAADLVGGPKSSAFAAVNRLTSAGVLDELSGRRWGRVFAASDVLNELDELESRIGRRVGDGQRRLRMPPDAASASELASAAVCHGILGEFAGAGPEGAHDRSASKSTSGRSSN